MPRPGVLNRVGMFIDDTGTGSIVADTVISERFNTPGDAGAVDGGSYYWMLEEEEDYEIFEGGWTAGTQTVSRDVVLQSKIAGVVGTSKMDLQGNATLRSVSPAEFLRRLGLRREERTSNAQLTYADVGKLIEITSGSLTQTFAAVATLGADWDVTIYNSGSGDVTLDPNGSEQIDGLTSFVMYPGEARRIVCTGSALESVVLKPFYRAFTATAAGGFVKPPGYQRFEGLMWGGGGSGGAAASGGGGGGGAACAPLKLLASLLGTTENITIGAAVAGVVNAAGNIGNNSTFAGVTAYGGGAGGNSAQSGSGGGLMSAGQTANGGGSPTVSTAAGDHNPGFGGGNGTDGVNADGGRSIFGGGGGGSGGSGDGGGSLYGSGGGGGGGNVSNGGPGGTSTFGGPGGAGGNGSPVTNGVAGTAPGGGGGGVKGTTATSGGGARGELRLWGVC